MNISSNMIHCLQLESSSSNCIGLCCCNGACFGKVCYFKNGVMLLQTSRAARSSLLSWRGCCSFGGIDNCLQSMSRATGLRPRKGAAKKAKARMRCPPTTRSDHGLDIAVPPAMLKLQYTYTYTYNTPMYALLHCPAACCTCCCIHQNNVVHWRFSDR